MDAVIGLGGNLGDPRTTLTGAVAALSLRHSLLAVSSLYETAPVGPPQPPFLNAAIRVDLRDSPASLLESLLEVERRFGRVRRERHGPRILDLDVLWIEGVVVATDALTVPHARLAERRFALQPLLDVAPDACDPATHARLADWLRRLPPGGVREVAGPDWAGTPAAPI